MKEPRSFNRPRLYWRQAQGEPEYRQRLRIIYPNGKAEWADGVFVKTISCWFDFMKPCWLIPALLASNSSVKSGQDAVNLMKQYDKKRGFKTVYLGEI